MAGRKKKEAKSQTVDSKAAPGTLENARPGVTNWASKPESEAYEEAGKLYGLVRTAYENSEDRAQANEEFWNVYNAIPDANQQYVGNSQCYVPAVRDALNARAKRTLKQMFPVTHRHIDVISADADQPYAQLSLLEHYIRKTSLKDTVRSDLIAGDVTGQWNLYIDWTKSYRKVRDLVRRNPILKVIDGEDVSDLDLEDPTADREEEFLEDVDVVEEGPEIVAFADEDLAVVPPTARDIESATATSMKLRMSKDKVQQMIDEGVFVMPAETEGVDEFFATHQETPGRSGARRQPAKQASEDAGVKTEGTDTHLLAYEVCAELTLEAGKSKQPAMIYFGGPDIILGIIRMPYWGGKRPILSAPVDKITGSFKGRSKIDPVKFLQWNLNDFWNMGQDSAWYSLLPIFATNPLRNPNWASMVMGPAAMWPIAPEDIKPILLPQLYKESMMLCEGIKNQIWESLDVNPMMMGKMPAGRKNNQLMGGIQQETQINISDHAERYEEVMLTPLVERLYEYDQQFRTRSVLVRSRGEIGAKMAMIEVEPQQWGERYDFMWYGTAFMIGQNRMQQQIAWMNVLKGIPPALLNGRKLSVLPIVEAGTENIFGPEVAPKILVDERNMFSMDPDAENQMMHNGFPVSVHEADNDVQHIQAHMRTANSAGDPTGVFKSHMGAHMMAVQRKREMQMAAMQQQPGAPGGPGGAGPGVGGTPPGPPSGAMPGQIRGVQNPPGAVHQDQMMDGSLPGRG